MIYEMITSTARDPKVLLALILGGLALQLSCGSPDADRALAERRDAILNGSPIPLADIENIGVPRVDKIETPSSAPVPIKGTSTGVLLTNDWVLTAHHAISDNVLANTVTLGSQPTRLATRLAIHPKPDLDLALLRVSPAFKVGPDFSSFSRSLSSLSTTSIVNGGSTNCLGYGPSSLNGALGTLRSATLPTAFFTPTLASPPDLRFFEVQRSNSGQIPLPGDSGGPCFSGGGEVQGILLETVSNLPGGPLEVQVASADAFRDWVNLILPSVASVNGDFNFDGLVDTVALVPENGLISVKILFGDPTLVTIPTLIPVPVLPVSIVSGDFNNDGAFDILALIDGVALYLNGASGPGLPTFNTNLTLLANNYVSLTTGDFNGDSITDVQALRPDGTPDIYFGGPDGLTVGRSGMAFPTADENDGKFITIGGGAQLDTTQTHLKIWIGVDHTESNFSVSVFDGDVSSTNDHPFRGAGSCYRLFADPLKDGTGTRIIAEKSDKSFGDEKWGVLFSGPVDLAAAATGSGDFFYRLEASIAADCSSAEDTTSPVLNAFKIMATGQVGFIIGDFSFIARDLEGPFAPRLTPGLVVTDTTFDGTFNMFIDAGDTPSQELVFTDADADSLLDRNPGVAVGANATIGYTICNSVNCPVTVPNQDHTDVPSGNLDEHKEIVATNGVGGTWTWSWTNVFTENNIHIFMAQGSPATYEMFGQPARRLSAASARSISYWLDNVPAIDQFLPVSLGTGTPSVNVATRGAALAIFDLVNESSDGTSKKVTICHIPSGNVEKEHAITIGRAALPAHLAHGDDLGPPEASERLLAELLAAKLHVADATRTGEPLSSGFVYGRETTVADVIQSADAVAVLPENSCALVPSQVESLNALTTLLHGINGGGVTYLAPGAALRAATAASRLAAPSGVPGIAGSY